MTNPRQSFFQKVYQDNLWTSEESASGYGSERWVCENLIRELPLVMKKYGVKSLLDAPCGDFNWMQHVNMRGVTYLGGDIVPEIIEQNNHKYGDSTTSFQVLDIVENKIPKVDMIFIRDLFIHCTLDLIVKSLHNIVNSGCSYIFLTQDTLDSRYPPEGNVELERAKDGVSYEFRFLNMTLAPFHLPAPLEIIYEAKEVWDGHKTMALWSRAQLIEAGFGKP
jgi:hypothetical protein